MSQQKPLSLDEAKNQCFSTINSAPAAQQVAIKKSLNRVLADDLIAPFDVPPAANSAMDGFAIRSADEANPLEVVATIYAGGKRPEQALLAGQCARVMTGALLPKGADMVVPAECTETEAGKIIIADFDGKSNIRLAGEDLAKGSVAIKKGRLLQPSDLGLMASLGVGQVFVFAKLRVAFFSTGDELRPITETLSDGQIHDSNRYSLFGLLSNLGVELLDLGVVEDDKIKLKKTLLEAAEKADVVITSGGVSVGQADFIKQILNEIGELNFWKLAVKPGRPLTFGQIDDAYFFGLPGNPVAVVVTFYQIVQPFLQRLMGQTTDLEPLLVDAVSLTKIKKFSGRMEFLRGNFCYKNQKLCVQKLSKQGSGVLSSMTDANCFIVLDEKTNSINKDEVVKIQPFSSLV